MQWSPGRSPHPQLLDVLWCSAAVVVVVEGSLEVKPPTIWTDEKQSREEAERRERLEERRVEEKELEERKIRRKKSRRQRVRRKKMQMREKVGKSRNTVFFQ